MLRDRVYVTFVCINLLVGFIFVQHISSLRSRLGVVAAVAYLTAGPARARRAHELRESETVTTYDTEAAR